MPLLSPPNTKLQSVLLPILVGQQEPRTPTTQSQCPAIVAAANLHHFGHPCQSLLAYGGNTPVTQLQSQIISASAKLYHPWLHCKSMLASWVDTNNDSSTRPQQYHRHHVLVYLVLLPMNNINKCIKKTLSCRCSPSPSSSAPLTILIGH